MGNYADHGATVLERGDDERELGELAFWYARQGKDKLFLLADASASTPKYMLVDGGTATGPHLWRANDPTKGGTGIAPSVEVSPRGVVRCLRNAPAFNFDATTLEANWRAEVGLEYKSEFWKGQEKVGKEAFPLLLEDDLDDPRAATQSMVASM